MSKIKTEGKCCYCQKNFSKMAIKKHLDSCDERKKSIEKEEEKNSKREKYFCISVEDAYSAGYWLYLDISSSSTLEDIDQFLRDIWLECCGHLSAFYINNETYDNNPEDLFEDDSMAEGMDIKIKDILNTGMQFTYDYDFGTTTSLKLKAISEREGNKRKNGIELMARNLPPEIKCSSCGLIAKHVCVECIYDNEGWLCGKCVKTHKCDEEMLLPVVNSPRVGECAYTGSVEDYEF